MRLCIFSHLLPPLFFCAYLPPAKSPAATSLLASECHQPVSSPPHATTPFLPPLPTPLLTVSLPGHQPLPSLHSSQPATNLPTTSGLPHAQRRKARILHVLSPAFSATADQLHTTTTHAVDQTFLTQPPPIPCMTRPSPTSLTQPPLDLARAVLSSRHRHHELCHRPLPPSISSGHPLPIRPPTASSFILHNTTTSIVANFR